MNQIKAISLCVSAFAKVADWNADHFTHF